MKDLRKGLPFFAEVSGRNIWVGVEGVCFEGSRTDFVLGFCLLVFCVLNQKPVWEEVKKKVKKGKERSKIP